MKKLFLLALVVPVFLGCKKEDDPDPAATKRDALAKAAWVQTALTVQPALNGQTDFFTDEEACVKDDLYRFAAGGKYTAEEGATKCATADPQIFHEGTWRLTQDEQRLLLEYNFIDDTNQRSPLQSSVREVVNLTDQQLQLRYRITDPNTGTIYTVSETFRPQP